MNAAWRALSIIQLGCFLVFGSVLCLVPRAQEQTDTAAKWQTLSAQQLQNMAKDGNAQAENQLGLLHATGRAGKTNYVEARKWFEKAADGGLAEAQSNLASLYLRGQGVPQSFVEALHWYRKAAEGGLAQAQYTLGWMYAHGKGIEPDTKQAQYWLTKAAEERHEAAQLSLGLLYLRGEELKDGSLQPNYIEAYKWINLAAASGNTNAIKHRNLLNGALSAQDVRTGQELAARFRVQQRAEASGAAE